MKNFLIIVSIICVLFFIWAQIDYKRRKRENNKKKDKPNFRTDKDSDVYASHSYLQVWVNGASVETYSNPSFSMGTGTKSGIYLGGAMNTVTNTTTLFNNFQITNTP